MLTREAAGVIVDRLIPGADNRESIIDCLVSGCDKYPRLQGIVGIDMARKLYDTALKEGVYDKRRH